MILFSASRVSGWVCRQCGKQYQWKESLYKHIRIECGKDPAFQCSVCLKKFKHKHHWKSHLRLIHSISYT